MADLDLLDLLRLEKVERNLFRANAVFAEEFDLYGGQVAAQALIAAGSTVEADRRPHSLHGYFLRRGDPQRPTVFKVYCDRDGRSFSARRVVAIQQGKVIFNMSTSFHTAGDGASTQTEPIPAVAAPDECEPHQLPRLFSYESRLPAQPYAGRTPWPTRFWARTTVALPPDPLQQAAALTYLSDISTGVLPAEDGSAGPGASLDHAVWFHDDADMNAWTLSDYEPHGAGHGRGWYTGSIFGEDGRLLASIAQECLFR